jgi:hypothetical protein
MLANAERIFDVVESTIALACLAPAASRALFHPSVTSALM